MKVCLYCKRENEVGRTQCIGCGAWEFKRLPQEFQPLVFQPGQYFSSGIYTVSSFPSTGITRHDKKFIKDM